MFRKILLLTLVLSLALLTAEAATFDGLPKAVQAAKELLTAPKMDSTKCHDTALELNRLVGTFPASSLVPEALFLAARLERSSNHFPESVALFKQVVEGHPATDFGPQAFDIVWDGLTKNGKDPLKAAEFAKGVAQRLGANPASVRYYNLAVDAYKKANRWKDAATAGEQCLKSQPNDPGRANTLLQVSDVALLAGNSPLAKQCLDEFCGRYSNLPQAISARTKLGNLNTVLGNTEAARENYSLAWSTFEKNSKKSGYSQKIVTSSAAEALLALQKEPMKEFEQLTAVENRLSKKQASQKLEDLESAYQKIMQTDPERAAVALLATGDLHYHLADALLKEGFRATTGSNPDLKNPPYEESISEYGKAVANYSLAFERGKTAEDNSEAQLASKNAAAKAFDVKTGEGDAVFAYALSLLHGAPQNSPSRTGNNLRFDYLATQVTPLLEQGIKYKWEALNMAANMPLASEARDVRETLDLPLRPVASELLSLCKDQIRQTESGSKQLATSFSYGMVGTSAPTLTQDLENSFACAAEYNEECWKIVGNLQQLLRQSSMPSENLAFWDNAMTEVSYDYASLCASVQKDLGVALANLSSQKDDASTSLYRRLNKVMTRGAGEEMAGLVRWHDFATRNSVNSPLNDKLMARLSEIDPKYRDPNLDIPSASRKKP